MRESSGPTQRRATGKTPFALVYGTECMIPAEVEFPGVRRRLLSEREELNNAMLLDDLDLINERRDRALIRIQNYQHAAAKYYNSTMQNRRFNRGDLVLRKVFQNTTERNAGKLGANWEGPYKIENIVRPGSYEIANMQGIKIPRTWNAMYLKKYYHETNQLAMTELRDGLMSIRSTLAICRKANSAIPPH